MAHQVAGAASWRRALMCAAAGLAGAVAFGAAAASADAQTAHLKRVSASQTASWDIVDLHFDRAPSLYRTAGFKNPSYWEQVRLGQSDDMMRLPGRAVLSVSISNANTWNWSGRQVPAARQQLNRRVGNILRARTHDSQHNRLDFAVAVSSPRTPRVQVNRQAKRVRIMIARRGKVQAVGCPEATNPLVPVGRWNAAFQITSATAMRCAQVPDVIRAGDDGLGWDVNRGSRFTIGAFACLTGAANPTTGVATATCRAGGRAFQVQERFIG